MDPSMLAVLNSLDVDSFASEEQRMEAIAAANAFLARAQKPYERLNNYAITVPSINAALVVCQDLHVFEKWTQTGQETIAVDELARLTGASSVLLGRILRHLASNHFIKQTGPERFQHTSLSRALIEPTVACWPRYYQDAMGPSFLSLAQYLREHEYKNPTEQTDCAFQLSKNAVGQSLFDYYPQHPTEAAVFNDCMGGYSAARVPWTTYYPTDELIVDGHDPVLVDVGGSTGHDVELFRKKHPDLASRLVLQDLPPVAANAKCDAAVNVQPHDFFTPQPVKGAKAYYLSTVLHDWSDEYAEKILRHIRQAAKPGYSRLLVNDIILPSMNAIPHMTMADMVMMVKMGSHERTEAMWKSLFESTGFRLVRILSAPGSLSSVMECEAV